VPVRLADLVATPRPGWTGAGTFDEFRELSVIRQLSWPDEVVQDWLWEHGRNDAFLTDYGNLDLEALEWTVEEIETAELVEMPTGPSDAGLIDHYAQEHEHWVQVRGREVVAGWTKQGTWLRLPLLLDRQLLTPPCVGLQVVEGRTRMGVLRGRARDGLAVAPTHRAWVGRARW
jgi:hypothetical protein